MPAATVAATVAATAAAAPPPLSPLEVSCELPVGSDGVCMICKSSPPDDQVLLCNTCASPWHMGCLKPPVQEVPTGDWYCPDCMMMPNQGDIAGPPRVVPVGAMMAPAGSDRLLQKILAIQNDRKLTEAEKAKRRQQLMCMRTKTAGGGGGGGGGGGSDEDEEEERSSGDNIDGSSNNVSNAANTSNGHNNNAENNNNKATSSESDKAKGNATLGVFDENLICSFCIKLCDRPVTTPCGHNFCLRCFERWISQGKRTCVKCRASLDKFASNFRINSALVMAIRLAKQAATSVEGRPPPKAYHNIANENRPDKAFTTERAVKSGKANACSGRIFVTVPPDHYGPITAEYDPQRGTGVLVGECWEDRMECRQWGAHLPHVAGISGQSESGAQSVCLSGGYADDEDHGEWFLYTGSGGRDLSGNKRTTSVQSFDQEFTKLNRALLLSCKRGFPLRVVRSHKEKRSAYAPIRGVRYDGIYRVEKCWRKKAEQGTLICRYLFVRCDNEPAPWLSDDHGDRPRPLPPVPELKKAQDIKERKVRPAWDWKEEEQHWGWTIDPPRSRHLNVRSEGMLKRKQLTIQQKLLKEFGCNLCRRVLESPLCTPCGHNFCKACLEGEFKGIEEVRVRGRPGGRTLRAQKLAKPCPMCKSDIAEYMIHPQVNREMEGIIDTLRKNAEKAEEDADKDNEEDGEDESMSEGEGDENDDEEEREEEEEADAGSKRKRQENSSSDLAEGDSFLSKRAKQVDGGGLSTAKAKQIDGGRFAPGKAKQMDGNNHHVVIEVPEDSGEDPSSCNGTPLHCMSLVLADDCNAAHREASEDHMRSWNEMHPQRKAKLQRVLKSGPYQRLLAAYPALDPELLRNMLEDQNGDVKMLELIVHGLVRYERALQNSTFPSSPGWGLRASNGVASASRGAGRGGGGRVEMMESPSPARPALLYEEEEEEAEQHMRDEHAGEGGESPGWGKENLWRGNGVSNGEANGHAAPGQAVENGGDEVVENRGNCVEANGNEGLPLVCFKGESSMNNKKPKNSKKGIELAIVRSPAMRVLPTRQAKRNGLDPGPSKVLVEIDSDSES
ncbi:hypothetical protein CBR_g38183 [Chara braunii]|uniref:RING-type E3 ubiquitin transferase n=1 Tax=Chara braunii TaxID=69332 RepID=A0A388LPK8_CHABU|nr:hypothetical protein CBR_g38183 [Chara braunii]|eukprot:GBG84211.1 hypothetical protein CBR_g38183 [Chara braunii]